MLMNTTHGKKYTVTSIKTCGKKCVPFKSNVQNYTKGAKRCYNCLIFIEYDGFHCPCCGITLRTRSRSYAVKGAKRI